MFNSKFRIATNGVIYQNNFEKKYTEKFCCLCINVFEPEEAFNWLKLTPNKYRLNALNRMNQYVRILYDLWKSTFRWRRWNDG